MRRESRVKDYLEEGYVGRSGVRGQRGVFVRL